MASLHHFLNDVKGVAFIGYQIVPDFVFFQNFISVGSGNHNLLFYQTKVNF